MADIQMSGERITDRCKLALRERWKASGGPTRGSQQREMLPVPPQYNMVADNTVKSFIYNAYHSYTIYLPIANHLSQLISFN